MECITLEQYLKSYRDAWAKKVPIEFICDFSTFNPDKAILNFIENKMSGNDYFAASIYFWTFYLINPFFSVKTYKKTKLLGSINLKDAVVLIEKYMPYDKDLAKQIIITNGEPVFYRLSFFESLFESNVGCNLTNSTINQMHYFCEYLSMKRKSIRGSEYEMPLSLTKHGLFDLYSNERHRQQPTCTEKEIKNLEGLINHLIETIDDRYLIYFFDFFLLGAVKGFYRNNIQEKTDLYFSPVYKVLHRIQELNGFFNHSIDWDNEAIVTELKQAYFLLSLDESAYLLQNNKELLHSIFGNDANLLFFENINRKINVKKMNFSKEVSEEQICSLSLFFGNKESFLPLDSRTVLSDNFGELFYERFCKNYFSYKSIALKVLFYIGSPREGLGARRLRRKCLLFIFEKDFEVFIKFFKCFSQHFRWDDVVNFIDNKDTKKVAKLCHALNEVLMKDFAIARRHPKNSSGISLLAKWMPSNNTTSYEAKKKARLFCECCRYSDRQYRKMLSFLRSKLNISERNESTKQVARNRTATVSYYKEIKFLYSKLYIFNYEDCFKILASHQFDFVDSLLK